MSELAKWFAKISVIGLELARTDEVVIMHKVLNVARFARSSSNGMVRNVHVVTLTYEQGPVPHLPFQMHTNDICLAFAEFC